MSYYCIFQYKYTYTFRFLKRVQSTEAQKTWSKSILLWCFKTTEQGDATCKSACVLGWEARIMDFCFLDEHIYQVKARLIMDEQMFSRELLAKCIAIHSWALPSSLAYRIVYTQQESNMESWTVVAHWQVSILYHYAVF